MLRFVFSFAAMLFSAVATSSVSATDGFVLKVEGIEQGAAIPASHAYCVADKENGSTAGENTRPAISWSGLPKGTQSIALIMVDPDVPTDFSNAGKKGKTIPASQNRQDFYHWVVVNIPATAASLPSGTGRGAEKTPLDIGQEGVNDYATFMPDAKAEDHLGYDGPCPPWNDERIHHYHFRLYALDVPSLSLKKGFSAKEAAAAILAAPHLGKAEVTGSYSLNPALVSGK